MHDSARTAIRRVRMTPARRARLDALREEDRFAAVFGAPRTDLSRFSLFGFLQDCPSLEVLYLDRGAETGSSLDGGLEPCAALRALRSMKHFR